MDFVHKNGEEYESADDDYGDEEGEFELENLEQLKAQMTEEQKEELKKLGITPEEYLMGYGADFGEDEGGEEEIDELGDDGEAEEGDAEKRAKTE